MVQFQALRGRVEGNGRDRIAVDRIPAGESAPLKERASRKVNDRAFPPKPQKARLGWGTEGHATMKREEFARATGRLTLSHFLGNFIFTSTYS